MGIARPIRTCLVGETMPDGEAKPVRKRVMTRRSAPDLDAGVPVPDQPVTRKPVAKKRVAKKPAAGKNLVRKKPAKTPAKKAAKKSAKKPVKKSIKTSIKPTSEATAETPDTDIFITPVVKRTPRKIAKVWYARSEPRPERLSATERLDLPPPATGAELIERVSWAIERELNQIELIVGGHRLKPAQRTEAERRARTLASLARTLSVVTQLREKNGQRPDHDDDDVMPRDLDELRDTLARRLERLVAERSQPADGESDGC